VRVIVVGGGIPGLMHAWTAVQRGHHVVHVEREAGPRGASVRNFGLLWVSGRRTGHELDLAIRARELWRGIGSAVPAVGLRPNGSLTVLRTAEEVKVATEVCARPDAVRRGLRLLDPKPSCACASPGSLSLTTGFSRSSQIAILEALGWTDLADLALVPTTDLRGRPYPDLVLHAAVRTGVDDVRAILAEVEPHLSVQCRRWLVEQQYAQLQRRRPSERDPLLLPAGELMREPVRLGRQTHQFQKLRRSGVAYGRRRLADPQPEGDVVPGGHVREQAVGLEHHARVAPVGRDTDDAAAVDERPPELPCRTPWKCAFSLRCGPRLGQRPRRTSPSSEGSAAPARPGWGWT
jgi:FAD dependent oxidoreductase